MTRDMTLTIIDEKRISQTGERADVWTSAFNERSGLCPQRRFFDRCCGLLARATVLAAGLCLGGAGPVLGAAANDDRVRASRAALDVHASPVKRPVRHDGLWTAQDDLSAAEHPSGPWSIAQQFHGNADDAGNEAITAPLLWRAHLWQQWRLDTLDREHVFGIGAHGPVARPDTTRDRASIFEVRF